MQVSSKQDIKPCPFCGNKSVDFSENEDWGYLYCENCGASIGIDLEDLPNYFELGDALTDCPNQTKAPLIEKWNTRFEPSGNPGKLR